MRSRPLFVTRKYPPSVGGMETLAAGVWRTLSAAVPDAVLVAHGGSNRALPRWLPSAAWRVLRAVLTGRCDLVLTGDALTYAVLRPMLALTGTAQATMVMGLDVTYPNRLYRTLVHPLLRRAPLVVAISEATAASVREVGVPPERVRVVRLGVPVPDVGPVERHAAGRRVRERLGLDGGTVVLLTLGRLVRRKGARWFVESVLPDLPSHVHYVLAGDGDQRGPIEQAARAHGVDGRVHLLGRVGDAAREELMRGADLFVQPNVRVPGDLEGFGLVVVEAAVRGTPVVAAALEGILDAVVDGETGLLLPPKDPTAWTAELTRLVADRDELAALGGRMGEAARARYGEQEMGHQLAGVLGLRPKR